MLSTLEAVQQNSLRQRHERCAEPALQDPVANQGFESACPHKTVAAQNPKTPVSMTRRQPNRLVNQPVSGVTTAVARILKVMTQLIWSGVAESVPCICGRTTLTISTVML